MNNNQSRVAAWVRKVFSEKEATDATERSLRTAEEAIELAQACGVDAATVHRLVDYVFSRPVGRPADTSRCSDDPGQKSPLPLRFNFERLLSLPARSPFDGGCGFSFWGSVMEQTVLGTETWSPDPSPRPNIPFASFTERCALNAIEIASRIFAGTDLHPRLVLSNGGLVWVDQLTRKPINA